MVLNPAVDREEVPIDGRMELCLKVFGGIRKYYGESKASGARLCKNRIVDTTGDLASGARESLQRTPPSGIGWRWEVRQSSRHLYVKS